VREEKWKGKTRRGMQREDTLFFFFFPFPFFLFPLFLFPFSLWGTERAETQKMNGRRRGRRGKGSTVGCDTEVKRK